ncbi:hypothetical protein GW17_00017752 [Ensete ventricosum]|nr:hypothetical protein GW17_00017752 [Ensete ventricosum]
MAARNISGGGRLSECYQKGNVFSVEHFNSFNLIYEVNFAQQHLLSCISWQMEERWPLPAEHCMQHALAYKDMRFNEDLYPIRLKSIRKSWPRPFLALPTTAQFDLVSVGREEAIICWFCYVRLNMWRNDGVSEEKSISACRLPMRMVTRFLFWAEEEESSYRGIGKQWGSYPPDLVLSSKGKVAEGTLRKRTQPLRADGIGRSARITGKRSSRISGQGIQWR